MPVLYIVGEFSSVGATAVTAALAAWARQAGKSVASIKPFAVDGADTFAAERADAQLLASLSTTGVEVDTQRFDDKSSEQLALRAASLVQGLCRRVDFVLVEGLPLSVGASGLFAQAIGATVVGVVPYRPSLSPDDARRWHEEFGEALLGVVLNKATLYAESIIEKQLAATLHQSGVSLLGVVPEDRVLVSTTVRQLAEHLDARFFSGEGEADKLVEHLIVGGLIAEWGGNYFGRYRHQAVIVRGSRIDIAMSALSFPLSCLLLTGCDVPAPYVLQRSVEENVPLLVVGEGTLGTMERLASLQERSTFHHPAKLERFARLLRERLDWEPLAAAGFRP